MGMDIFISTERPLNSVKATDMEGRFLCKELQSVDFIAKSAGVTPVSEMVSFNSVELASFMEGEGIEGIAPPPEQWFEPSMGIAAVSAILAALEKEASNLQRPQDVVGDLREARRILQAAAEQGIRFHFSMDTP